MMARSLKRRLQTLVLMVGAGAALAAGPAPAEVAHGLRQAALLPGWRTADGAQMAGLELRLAQGWKTYWRAPGEGGFAPAFDWSGSENLAQVTVHWPRPRVFNVNGLQSIGYARDVVLPLEVRPQDPALPVRLRGQVELGVCEDVCVPLTLGIEAELPREPDAAVAGADRVAAVVPTPMGSDDLTGGGRIRAALAAAPDPASRHGLSWHHCSVQPAGRGVRLTATLRIAPLRQPETAVIELGNPDLWVSNPALQRDGDVLIATSTVLPGSAAGIAIDRGSILITLLSGDVALEIRGCPALP
jgi:DsbC/DsbD-like thiol-disulfide interchange protein